MILLDTNVLSELMRPTPEAAVERWLAEQPAASVFISAITEAELRYGVALLPAGKRRSALAVTIEAMLVEDFGGRILPFDSQAAIAFAEIATARRQAGRPISQADAQIAAIARSRGATLATRNVADFEQCGITIINPWHT
ncbi:ribonuclease VapC [Acidocella aquatica]|uniref:Ribonuclease VapC n=1 Tax=Acidocella aquatica TaxID=1922313 RepID=A0ABQ6A5J8_9PROT|nr:type II toxin-antitoxin system VapC family toxin [Acidocella aquatica]GLR66947.1 ribonuclease VapC [Acidocella aquatica]